MREKGRGGEGEKGSLNRCLVGLTEACTGSAAQKKTERYHFRISEAQRHKFLI